MLQPAGKTLRRALFASLAAAAALAAAALAAAALAATLLPGQAHAQSAHQAADGIGKYLGTWNYDQPDRATMTNIAVLHPGALLSPQEGYIVFTPHGDDAVVGRTDVGCTWTFAPGQDGLHLDPATQTCHNPTLDVWYTISSWTVTVAGRHEKETIKATSPSPIGTFSWVLQNGTRTRADDGARSAWRFAGEWRYAAPDPATGQNIRVTRYTGPDGKPVVTQTGEQGVVTITRDYAGLLTARTQDGCTWTLQASGNLAELDPAVQTCMTSAASDVVLRYWAISSDGHQQFTTMAGTDAQGHDFTIGAGALSKG